MREDYQPLGNLLPPPSSDVFVLEQDADRYMFLVIRNEFGTIDWIQVELNHESEEGHNVVAGGRVPHFRHVPYSNEPTWMTSDERTEPELRQLFAIARMRRFLPQVS